MHFRNNLILGQGARNAVFAIDTYTNYSSSDYNGFMPNSDAEHAYQWNSPPFETLADFEAEREQRRFATLEDYSAATGQDEHSIEIDYSIFRNASQPDFTNPTRLVAPEDVDLRLSPDSRAADAGMVLPTITDGYTGRAPDLGAYEVGTRPPHYGPREPR